MAVKKSSIYIEPEVDRALARRAEAEGVPKAAVIRAALRAHAAAHLDVRPRARGVFNGPPDLGRDADRYLDESGFGET